MSHDRGCPCGREKWDYASCPEEDCHKKETKMADAVDYKDSFKEDYEECSNITDAMEFIMAETIASCSCMTKSPDMHYHQDDCRYKKLMIVYTQLDQLNEETHR